jgi:hypothetical protein
MHRICSATAETDQNDQKSRTTVNKTRISKNSRIRIITKMSKNNRKRIISSNKQQQQQQQQEQQSQQVISKEDAERLLNSIANDEKNVQEKVKLAIAANARVKTLKNW